VATTIDYPGRREGSGRAARPIFACRKAQWLLVAAALAAAVAAAPASAAGGSLQSGLTKALHAPFVDFDDTAAVAVDLDTGAVVYSHNANLALRPASNEKLAITYAALTALGPAFRIETDVLGEGAQDGTTWSGSLVLKGYGDPMLSSADVTALAQQVRADGITRVAGQVVGDETWFDAHRTAPGWKASFYITESPPLSALIVNRGLVGRTTSHSPALAAAQLFRKALVAAGVQVTGSATLGTADTNGVELGSVESPTLEAMVHYMDINSDNFTAEMLTKELGAVQLGQGTTAAGLRVVVAQLAAADVPLGGVRLADGSGLSLLDRLTASSLVSLLRVMWSDSTVEPELLASLPVAGRTGTLHDRMRGTAAAGIVHAKTGTTDNSTALSGFAGDRYVFSVLVNGAPVSWTYSRLVEDRFAELLAKQLRSG
jgi:D-alanyl-D-alanine carboxypeptidase/D-alanyl-D-alanine-endopeptidase (penicillin-binding protein 4)